MRFSGPKDARRNASQTGVSTLGTRPSREFESGANRSLLRAHTCQQLFGFEGCIERGEVRLDADRLSELPDEDFLRL